MASRRARGKLILLLAFLLLLPSMPARAAEFFVTCATLQGALDAASDGDIITIEDSGCAGTSYTMKTGTEITLQGAPTSFSLGASPTSRILSGLDIGDSIFRDMNFIGASSDQGGGGMAVTGTVAPTFESVNFIDNTAALHGGGLLITSTASSGTIRIVDSTFNGNRANESGGGLWINALQAPNVDVVIESSTFTDNSAHEWGGGASTITGDFTFEGNAVDGNSAGSRGGGAYFAIDQAAGALTGNTFTSNRVEPEPGIVDGFYGGGLYLAGTGGSEITQVQNVFDGNEVTSEIFGPGIGGAGEYIVRANFNGTSDPVEIFINRDRFINNFVHEPSTTAVVRGGGLGANTVHIEAWNTVAAGNRINTRGEARGAGMYVGDGTLLTLINSTVSGNTTGNGIPGVGGDVDDTLTIHNSIVAGNTGTTADIFGFGTVDAQFTDSCTGVGFAGGPLPGPGNICADPLLVNPAPGTADVHQTAGSPTRDAGSNALVPAALTTDYEGDDRIMDSNADGVEVVDMGADELLQPLIIQPQPAPLQQAAAPPGRIPATGPEDVLPQSLAAFSYVLLGILLLRVTTPKWQAAWRATSYGARHSGRRRGKYTPKHRSRRRSS